METLMVFLIFLSKESNQRILVQIRESSISQMKALPVNVCRVRAAIGSGPFQGSIFLVGVVAYSKWPEVHVMSATTASATLGVLREDTGKMTIKDGINDFPSFFINGLIYGTKTDLLEDGLREDAVKQTRRTESVKAPLSGLRLHYRRGRTSASSPSPPPL